jgi:hypothetical protein
VTKYAYDEQIQREVERMARLAMPHGTRLEFADLKSDFGGIDATMLCNYHCPLQIRTRMNRPIWAADADVTFRTTEPRMMVAGTYAPLALFIWMRDGWAEAGKLVDVYRMFEQIDPPLGEREKIPNGDGTFFHVVTIGELHDAQALLRQGGRDQWAAAHLGGDVMTQRILDRWVMAA